MDLDRDLLFERDFDLLFDLLFERDFDLLFDFLFERDFDLLLDLLFFFFFGDVVSEENLAPLRVRDDFDRDLDRVWTITFDFILKH